MPNECRIQFYFRADDLRKLLNKNPDAKGIIVSQEISREKPNGAVNYVNVAHIRATVDMGVVIKTQSAALMEGTVDPPEDGIDGCPFPPGCTP